jgi:hypothetical protein
MALLRNDNNKQASLISEGVAEIWINITLQANNLTIWHMWATQAPLMAIVHDDYKKVEPDPPYPSASLPRDTSPGIRGCPLHYPKVTREVQWGVVQLSDRQRY